MENDTRTPKQLSIALARNVADMARRIMEDNPQHVRERTYLNAAFIEAEAKAYLRRVLPDSKRVS